MNSQKKDLDVRTTQHERAKASLITREEGGETIQGYGAVFYKAGDPGTEYRLYDDYVERIAPGAFDQTIKEDDIISAFNHNFDLLLGRTSAETLRLSVDEVGLRYEVDPPDSPNGNSVLESVRRKDVTGASFAFFIRNQNLEVAQEDGREILIRTILDVQMFEVGPVAFPAYTGTTAEVSARSLLDLAAFRQKGTPLLDIRKRKLLLAIRANLS